MDPATAIANAFAEFFKWATSVRETMKPELRDEHDRNVLQFLRDFKKFFGVKDDGTPQ